MCGIKGELSFFRRRLHLVHDDGKSTPCDGCDVALDFWGRPVFKSTDPGRKCVEEPRVPVRLSDVGL